MYPKRIIPDADRAAIVESYLSCGSRQATSRRMGYSQRIVIRVLAEEQIPQFRFRNEATFWSRVKKSDGCWEWQGKIKRGRTGGYGLLMWKGEPDARAHRVAYELSHGPIPSGKLVCHTCDNPPCCRPDHLFLGTSLENMQDAKAKGRIVRGHCVGSAKLTEQQVKEVRERHALGESGVNIAHSLSVTPSMIYRILAGLAWSWLD